MSARTDTVITNAREHLEQHPHDALVSDLLELLLETKSVMAGLNRRINATITHEPTEQDDLRDLHALRGRLMTEGADAELIDRAVDQLRLAQLIARHGEDEARKIVYSYAPRQPNDSRYRPKSQMAELTGPGRATGIAARAVKAGTTVTDWQYRDRATTGEQP